jgi:hypothetical protein
MDNLQRGPRPQEVSRRTKNVTVFAHGVPEDDLGVQQRGVGRVSEAGFPPGR